MVKCFNRLGAKAQDAYMNTYRNGLVSAVAMAYNFHCPLLLCPNDLWLVILQGFKIHLERNANREYMKWSFKDLEKIDSNVQKALVIDDPSLKDFEKMDDLKFEEAFLSKMSSATD
jgi:hypothetical protein